MRVKEASNLTTLLGLLSWERDQRDQRIPLSRWGVWISSAGVRGGTIVSGCDRLFVYTDHACSKHPFEGRSVLRWL